jgi:hypothetical protein
MDIHYDNAAPLRTSPCLAWLIEYGAGGKDVLFTADTMTVEEVIRMVQNHTHDDFRVSNITVGLLPISPQWSEPNPEERSMQVPPIPKHLKDLYSLYFGDGRKIDSEGMVQV